EERAANVVLTAAVDRTGELEHLCALLRDIVFDPSATRPLIAPDWLSSDVITLGRAVYDTGDFSIGPVLADALEDAGCTEVAILEHLRGPGPHVRGCWAVDLILGKE